MRFSDLNRAAITIVAAGALLGGLELAAAPEEEGRSPLRVSEVVRMEGDKLRVAIMDPRRGFAETFRLAFTLSPGAELYTLSLGPPESKLPPLSAIH